MITARIVVTGTAGDYDLRLNLADGHNQNMIFNDDPYFAVDVIDLPNRTSHQAIVNPDTDPLHDAGVSSAVALLYKAATGGDVIEYTYRGNARLWILESVFNALAEAIEVRANELRSINYAPASREKLANALSSDTVKLAAWARSYILKGY